MEKGEIIIMTMRWASAACLTLAALATLAGPASAQTIGADAYGYTATGGNAAFQNVAVAGNTFRNLGDDGTLWPVNIGFNFNFYGVTHSQIGISNNGLIQFGGVSSAFSNTNLTSTAAPDSRQTIAVLWDDWITNSNLSNSGVWMTTLGATGSRQFIAQWNLERHFSGPSNNYVTFQAVLFEGSNDIEFRYLDVAVGGNSNGSSATIGIQDADGHTNGRNLQWSYNTNSISNGRSIRFSAPNVSAVPEAGGMINLLGGMLAVGTGPAIRMMRLRKARNA